MTIPSIQFRLRAHASALVLAAAAAAPVAGLATSAAAQQAAAPAAAPALEEIVVTARRVSENLQQVPQSVTALNTQTLRDNHIQSVYDIKSIVPNLFQSKTATIGGGLMFIRGIQSQGLPNATLDTRVGIYVDGVYIARPEGVNAGKADIDQVEVLKGPQGTLFGRNVTAGAINFITASPAGVAGGEISASYGNYNQNRFKITLNSPEWHGLAVRATFAHDAQHGQISNLASGTQYGPGLLNTSDINYYQQSRPSFGHVDGHNNNDFFFSARYTGIDRLTVDYKFDYSDDRENTQEIQNVGVFPSTTGCVIAGYYLGLPTDFCLGGANTQFTSSGGVAFGNSPTIGVLGRFVNGVLDPTVTSVQSPLAFTKDGAKALDFSAGAVIRGQGHNLTLQYEVTPDIQVKNIAAYRQLTANGQIDTDGEAYVANPLYFNNLLFSPGNVPTDRVSYLCASCSYNRQQSRQFSNEFQVIGKWGHTLDYLVGFYYFDEHTAAQSYYGTDFVPNLTYGTPAAFLPAAIQPLFPNGIPGLNAIPPLTPGQPVLLNTSGFANGEYEHFSSKSWAPYAHVTFHLGDKIDLAAGIRYTTDSKTDQVPASVQAALVQNGLQSAGTDLKVTYNRLTYDGTITYKVNDDFNVYTRYATAYLAGGFFNSSVYVPETSWSEEVGMKSEWLDRRLRLNAALFYQSTSNAQDTGQTEAGGIYVANLPGKVVNKGFELDTSFVPIEGLTLSGSVGFTKLDYPCTPAYDATTLAPLGTCFTRQQNSPEWTATMAGQYDAPRFSNGMYVSFRVDAQYQSEFANLTYPTTTSEFAIKTPAGPFINQGQGFERFDLTSPAASVPGTPEYNYKALLGYLGYDVAGNPNGAFDQYVAALDKATHGGGYWLVNARVSLVDLPVNNNKARISLYVNNLFNELSATNGSNYGGYFGESFEQYRTYGVDVSFKF